MLFFQVGVNAIFGLVGFLVGLFLFRKLIEDHDNPDSSNDFGKDIIPSIIDSHHVLAYPFQQGNGEPAYWRDVGTLESYWQANMDLCSIVPELNLYDRDWPVWTYQAQLPPAKFTFDDEGRRGQSIDSMVSAGCIISGARVKRSVISSGCTIHSYTQIKDSVILPRVEISRDCVIQNAIIDKGCYIPPGTQIGVDIEADRKRFHVEDNGLVLVTPSMLGQSLHFTR